MSTRSLRLCRSTMTGGGCNAAGGGGGRLTPAHGGGDDAFEVGHDDGTPDEGGAAPVCVATCAHTFELAIESDPPNAAARRVLVTVIMRTERASRVVSSTLRGRSSAPG